MLVRSTTDGSQRGAKAAMSAGIGQKAIADISTHDEIGALRSKGNVLHESFNTR